MRCVVLGPSALALRHAAALHESGWEICALISMPPALRPENSADIDGFGRQYQIPYHELEEINTPQAVRCIQGYAPDYIFSAWPKLLESRILAIPQFFCVGTHPTPLPFNRGRHPLHWMVVLGITDTVMSFIRMDEGIDTGNVLLRVPFRVAPEDTISDAMDNMLAAAYLGTRLLCQRLPLDPLMKGTRQDHEVANYWGRGTPHDVTLDVRMSVSAVLRTVRSFSAPYPYPTLMFRSHLIKIAKASRSTLIMPRDRIARLEPGRILRVSPPTMTVKVDDGLVDLECMGAIPPELLEVKYIHPPSKYLMDREGSRTMDDAAASGRQLVT